MVKKLLPQNLNKNSILLLNSEYEVISKTNKRFSDKSVDKLKGLIFLENL